MRAETVLPDGLPAAEQQPRHAREYPEWGQSTEQRQNNNNKRKNGEKKKAGSPRKIRLPARAEGAGFRGVVLAQSNR